MGIDARNISVHAFVYTSFRRDVQGRTSVATGRMPRAALPESIPVNCLDPGMRRDDQQVVAQRLPVWVSKVY